MKRKQTTKLQQKTKWTPMVPRTVMRSEDLITRNCGAVFTYTSGHALIWGPYCEKPLVVGYSRAYTKDFKREDKCGIPDCDIFLYIDVRECTKKYLIGEVRVWLPENLKIKPKTEKRKKTHKNCKILVTQHLWRGNKKLNCTKILNEHQQFQVR